MDSNEAIDLIPVYNPATTEGAFKPIETIKTSFVELSFIEALQKVINGSKVARLSWNDKSCFAFYKDNLLKLFIGNTFHEWLISKEDIDANDWIVVND